MFMYEGMAERLWDKGATEEDIKCLYRDCHKGPILHVTDKMVFLIVCNSFHIYINATEPWITVIFIYAASSGWIILCNYFLKNSTISFLDNLSPISYAYSFLMSIVRVF